MNTVARLTKRVAADRKGAMAVEYVAVLMVIIPIVIAGYSALSATIEAFVLSIQF